MTAANQRSNARIAAEDAAAQVDQLLLGALSSEGGAFADVLAGGAVTESAADVLAQAEGVGVASSSGGGTLRITSMLMTAITWVREQGTLGETWVPYLICSRTARGLLCTVVQ